ncbi:hypothetical protein QIH80_40660 [Bradyrhizobium elkanii]|nr:hypothetical protein QIH80_40660 [Bradyrhizobium elkanii]
MLAYDDDRRVVGACRTARAAFGLTDAMIEDGIDLSHLVQLDDRATRAAGEQVALRRADGTPWGRGHLAPPVRARSPRPPSTPPREQPPEQFFRPAPAGGPRSHADQGREAADDGR